MVKVSTLFYVLEDLEGMKEELIDLEEIHKMEQLYLNGLFGRIDRAGMEVNPTLVKNILKSASSL